MRQLGKTAYLEQIRSPADVKKLNIAQMRVLCDEIRAFLIDEVSRTGGHLSSNLGTIELTVALHKVFTTPKDKLVFDVGHQCYTHKILTGRRGGFARLRMKDGLSGFPAPDESEHDAFVAGHGNTALSIAIGLATAKKLKKEPGKVIAIIGDGAFTGGMVYEGMNNIRALDNLIVILNDNKMSISKNVGAVAEYLTRLRTSPRYFKAKRDVQSVLDSVPVIGVPIREGLQNVKGAFRRLVYNSTMFEEMGFQYVGVVDGHDLAKMCTLFTAYRNEQSAPLFVHIATIKGKGFEPAEQNPGEFHGVSAFDVNHITDPDIAPDSSFSTVFGTELAELGEQDKSLCAITAAMKYGTGLQFFYKRHKERFFDVGMAEQHAVTFAAGLARAGMRPVVSIYSTFLQRSYDQLLHDVALMDLDVLLAVDRAGLVPGDGQTHQGIYDAAYLSQVPHMRIVSPCNYAELTHWLRVLAGQNGPRALRYPRGAESSDLAELPCTGQEYDVFSKPGARRAIVTYGALTQEALAAQDRLMQEGIAADVYKLCVIHPLPQGVRDTLESYDGIVFAEEGIETGGVGQQLASALCENQYRGAYRHLAVHIGAVTHATVPELRELCGIDAVSIVKAVKEVCS